jgi:hypothetical protein
MTFPNSKIELHQWANSLLLGIVNFFVIQNYNLLQTDHEKLAAHETRITVAENSISSLQKEDDNQNSQLNSIGEAILIEPFKRKRSN